MTIEPWQIDSALLALHNIAGALGSLAFSIFLFVAGKVVYTVLTK